MRATTLCSSGEPPAPNAQLVSHDTCGVWRSTEWIKTFSEAAAGSASEAEPGSPKNSFTPHGTIRQATHCMENVWVACATLRKYATRSDPIPNAELYPPSPSPGPGTVAGALLGWKSSTLVCLPEWSLAAFCTVCALLRGKEGQPPPQPVPPAAR